ncbi:redox-regulated ATPase YchF [Candidatus Haliotispira prima]|uniref:Ribosome-binding ATPase YchF n=1 Tax=Candidatus Haliotispira prima TaxID=3034016 RepID=A0ABY8MLP2_9SPIO|nr:redox-regulated ATPase YchF [Candidatus Haliotispira prima]
MALNCGIVGLPNVGKSTIFSALTAAPAEAANYPFCTIDPNKGTVSVPDVRLERIARMIPAEKTIYTTMEFVDIAGLVKGASAGEGLGNRFLANIRETDLIVHVVRCFENSDIVHVDGSVDALRDVETVSTELILADMAGVDKARERYERLTRANDAKQRAQCTVALALLDRVAQHLNELKPVRQFLAENELSEEEEFFRNLHFITAKPQIYLCNVSEKDVQDGAMRNAQSEAIQQLATREGAQVLGICGQMEADIAELDDPEERRLFLQELGLVESGLDQLARLASRSLGLGSFFTVGDKENKAWTFRLGNTAPQCAGKIHTDFERGFIKAEVFHCDDLFAAGSETAVRSAGKLRLEGKAYIVRDGDVMHFKFNT